MLKLKQIKRKRVKVSHLFLSNKDYPPRKKEDKMKTKKVITKS